MVARHLPSPEQVSRVAEDLCDEGRERKAADEHDALFTERGKHPIALLDGERRSDGDGLLARAGPIEADAALALELDHARVEQAEPAHLPVAVEEGLPGELRVCPGERAPVVAEDAQEAYVGLIPLRVR